MNHDKNRCKDTIKTETKLKEHFLIQVIYSGKTAPENKCTAYLGGTE